MTIAEVLRKTDMIKPNRFTKEQKIGWLDEIERQIWYDIVCTHDNPMRIGKPAYDINTDPDTVLIAPAPYDELYCLYLQCQIDLGNMEIAKYNNNRTLFNNALMSFRDYWNRTFMPCRNVNSFIFDDRRRYRHMPYNGHPIYGEGDPLATGHHHMPHHHHGPHHDPHHRGPHPIGVCPDHMNHHEHMHHDPLVCKEPGPHEGPYRMPPHVDPVACHIEGPNAVPHEHPMPAHHPHCGYPHPIMPGTGWLVHGLPKMEPLKGVKEEIVEAKAINCRQQKQINELMQRKPESDEALSTTEVGEIIG